VILVGPTAKQRFAGLKYESSDTQVAYQARSDGGGQWRTRKYEPGYRPRSSPDSIGLPGLIVSHMLDFGS